MGCADWNLDMVQRTKVTSLLAAATLVSLSVAAAIILAEAAIRVVSPQPVGRALPMYERDPVLAHRLKPGFKDKLRSNEFDVDIVINSRGFRGAEWSTDARRPILVLGDSFTFGYGVPEDAVFTALLQDSLRRLESNVTVYNAGVPGYGTTQEQQLLEQLWSFVKPQVVILAFTVGSDLRNVVEQNLQEELGYQVKDGFLVPKGMQVGQSLPIKAFFQERSHLYVLLQKTRVRMSLRGTAQSQPTRDCEHFLARNPCGAVEAAWRLVGGALSEMKSRCDGEGAQLVLLSIPHPVQIYDDLWERELELLNSSVTTFDRLGVQTRLRVVADSLGVITIDPTSAFRRSRREQLYFSLDRHMTESGHRIIASKLLQVMAGSVKGISEEVVDRS